MNSLSHYAIIASDKSGAAYGIGRTEDEARRNAENSGFHYTDGIAVKITASSYERIANGNVDAVEIIDD